MNKSRVRFCALGLLMCTALYSGHALAQWEKPEVGGKFVSETGFYAEKLISIPARAAAHDDYSRMVLDWPSRVTYDVDDSKKGLILLKFKRRALVDLSGVKKAPETNFGDAEVISGLNQHLVIAISVPENAVHKVYTLGYKIVIDVQDVPGQKRGQFNKIPLPEKAANAAAPEETLNAPAEATEMNAATPATPNTETTSPASVQSAAVTVPASAPIRLSWTSTKVFDVAAFARGNAVYFVTSKNEVAFAPQVDGNDARNVTITRLPNENGQVYRAAFASNVAQPTLSAAGANLSWDFTIFPSVKPGSPPAVLKIMPDKNNKPAINIATSVSGSTFDFTDPDTGETFTVLPASTAQNYIGTPVKTPDVELLPSAAGVVMRKLNDTMTVALNDRDVQLSLPDGFNYSATLFAEKPPLLNAEPSQGGLVAAPADNTRRILNFSRWLAGLPNNYSEARQILESHLLKATPEKQTEGLINLARFELAQGYGPEALGYLDLALEKTPPLARDPEYHALRGVALTMMGDSDNALPDLNDPLLSAIPEMGMWRAFALSLDYDWVNAYKSLPANMNALAYYPRRVQSPVSLAIAEVLLRNNKPQQADQLLSTLEHNIQTPTEHEKAAIGYLRGEALRMQGQPVKAIELWNNVANSHDQLYRVKAILAQTILQLQQRAIKPEEAIEKLERLRFAWRGDGLETQIAQVLGRQYLANKQWNEAFELMRGAAGFAQGTAEGDAIASAMTQSFSQLYTNPPADLKPVEAISLYDRFPELTPPGEEGKAVLRGLASFLLQMDLLDRAAAIYTKLLPQDKNGIEVLNDGLQLVAIHLLAREPEEALKFLDSSEISTAKGSNEQARQRSLLRARALADLKKYQDAFDVLGKLSIGNDSLALITDTAWAAGRWELAAKSLDMIFQRTKPDLNNLTPQQIDLIFNRGVSLKLANNAGALAGLRMEYLDKIKDSNKRTQFEALTRPASTTSLADRQTLLDMAQEVDLFKSFLTPAAPPPVPAAVTPAPAATAATPAKPAAAQ